MSVTWIVICYMLHVDTDVDVQVSNVSYMIHDLSDDLGLVKI